MSFPNPINVDFSLTEAFAQNQQFKYSSSKYVWASFTLDPQSTHCLV